MTPTEITYVHGDATAPQGGDPKIIAHICNDAGAWGAGFVLAISARWPEPRLRYMAWAVEKDKQLPLGRVQYVDVGGGIHVANMVAQRGWGASDQPRVDYEALDAALRDVFYSAGLLQSMSNTRQVSVHMPRIGCGLGGGSWDQVEPIIIKNLCQRGIPVTVYDWP